MKIRRYSHAYKLQAVHDIESPHVSAAVVVRKYSHIDGTTLMSWMRQFGSANFVDSAADPEKRNRPAEPSYGAGGGYGRMAA